MTAAHQHQQLGEYKATLQNPHVSEEAKAHAAEVLKKHGVNPDDYTSSSSDVKPIKQEHGEAHGHSHGDGHEHHHDRMHEETKGEGTAHEHRVLGGYKATLHNPHTSPHAKGHAAEVLAEHDIKL